MAKRPYHHGSLREALLAEVAVVVREKGVGEVSLRELARRLGVSHGAPAAHFANKRALLTAFAAEGYQRLSAEVLRSLKNGPTDARDVLGTIGRAYVRFALRHPAHFEVMFRPELADPAAPVLRAASDAAFNLLRRTIRQCAIEGRLGRRNPEHVAIAAWSLSHGFATLWMAGRLPARFTDHDVERLSGNVHRTFVRTMIAGRARRHAKRTARRSARARR